MVFLAKTVDIRHDPTHQRPRVDLLVRFRPGAGGGAQGHCGALRPKGGNAHTYLDQDLMASREAYCTF